MNTTLVQLGFLLIALFIVSSGVGVFIVLRRVLASRHRRTDDVIGAAEKTNFHENCLAEKDAGEAVQTELVTCSFCGTKFLYRKNHGTSVACPNCERPYSNR
ncbi:hypothetical protein [Desulfuromonas sp. AOP6]|uniref:hypothetical protein n=1 Tax=Desulfuromonas sp. AOP6 TaxID=1566351 RepID=UPI00127ECE7A|nr:hypothetical protein [Desulfuromonas sp. AOP6]BCA80718.1 hypothetical protein AOP6_2505 [Desulfuromonas sp. AOP6]